MLPEWRQNQDRSKFIRLARVWRGWRQYMLWAKAIAGEK
jgi:hypothetical protein